MNKIKGIIVCSIILLAALFLMGYSIAADAEYDRLTAGMVEHTAVVTDIKTDVSANGQRQIVCISYSVNGVEYSRELGTDTALSFAAGAFGNMKVGDSVKIFYDPDDPETIAADATSSVGTGMFVLSLIAFIFFTVILILFIMGDRIKKPARRRQ